jgi:hypothetical protein
VLSIRDLLLHILQVFIHDSDPASIIFQLQVHLLQLLLQGLQSRMISAHKPFQHTEEMHEAAAEHAPHDGVSQGAGAAQSCMEAAVVICTCI